jgi:hypothetical protein
MNRIGTRIVAMNIRLDVNQSMFLLLESPQESYLFISATLCKDYVLLFVM